MKIAISVFGLEKWFGGDLAGQTELVRIADGMGVDQVSVVDHVIMGGKLDEYPYGSFPVSAEQPWLEPLIQLAHFASVTKQIRLATGIIIAPLRPAAVLAKQIATLDVLSHGRMDVGVGVGWQKDEYDACNVPWDKRFALLEEQVRVCRALWGSAPASFSGESVRFERLSALPFPLRGRSTPVWFGIGAFGRNIGRIAELGDGWLPMERDPEKLKAAIATLRAAFRERGRDPAALQVRASYQVTADSDGRPDLAATLAQTKLYADAGVTVMRIEPAIFCTAREDYEPFLEQVLKVK